MTPTSETRHAYVYAGISWDAFMDWAVRKVKEDSNLTYYVHNHRYLLHTVAPKGCNKRCKIVRSVDEAPVVEGALPEVVESTVASSEGE